MEQTNGMAQEAPARKKRVYRYRWLMRVTLEFTTSFIISAGLEGEIADAVCVTDANGLPAIPGSSLAGVMRAEYTRSMGRKRADQLFGYQNAQEGAGSLLKVSWACIHDSDDKPVEGIIPLVTAPPDRKKDPVLAAALSPVIRNHVLINHKGAADAARSALFNDEPVCAGHRFTFEMELIGAEAQKKEMDEDWKKLRNIFSNPTPLRLGGKTRSGYGAFKIVKRVEGVFDFCEEGDFKRYASVPVSLADLSNAGLQEAKPDELELSEDEQKKSEDLVFELKLKPTGYWMFGGGTDLPEAKGNTDRAPLRDKKITWNEKGKGVISENLAVIPAASIKGALAHRTAFHYNCLKERFVPVDSVVLIPACWVGENNDVVKELFGCSKNDKGGKRGRVVMDDKLLEKDDESQLIHHNGNDRFSGGVLDKILYDERPFWRGPELILKIRLEDKADVEEKNYRKAFFRAVEDLACERLQVGAGSGRGNGYFTDENWPKTELENWVNEDQS